MSEPSTEGPLLRRPAVDVKRLDDGGLVLRSPYPPAAGGGPPDWLDQWAQGEPQRVFVAQRAPNGKWRELTYGAARTKALAVADALAAQVKTASGPVALLVEDGMDSAVLRLGLLRLGVGVLSVSLADARPGEGFGEFERLVRRVRPSFAYAVDEVRYADAMAAVAEAAPGAPAPEAPADDPFRDDPLVRVLRPDDGGGAAVAVTRSMVAAGQAALAGIWPFLAERPPRLVHRLSWRSSAGAALELDLALRHGGSLHVAEARDGKAYHSALGEVAPTLIIDSPKGLESTLGHMETDGDFAAAALADLDMFVAVGQSPPGQSFRKRVDLLASSLLGRRIPVAALWGPAECYLGALATYSGSEKDSHAELPLPGALVKLAAVEGGGEILIEGPMMAPGQIHGGGLVARVADADGFHATGQMVELADPLRPFKGLVLGERSSDPAVETPRETASKA